MKKTTDSKETVNSDSNTQKSKLLKKDCPVCSNHLESISEKVPSSIKKLSEKVSQKDSDKKKVDDSLGHYVNSSQLRVEMIEKASVYESPVESQDYIKKGRGLLNNVFSHISDEEIGQLYWQFTLFDLDKDGFISLEDLKGLVACIDPLLPKKADFEEKCKNWFGRQTFYHSVPLDESVEIKVSFENYVTELFNFRRNCEKYGISDNLLFPFWSLRDCILYSAHRPLEGWAWKRGKNGGWKQRHFKMCKKDESNPGANVSLEYFLNDDPKSPVKKAIDLRQLISVWFSPSSKLPKGKDIPSDLVVFKLLLGDGKRYCIAVDHDTAIKWTSIFSWYACAGKITAEWRIQYGDVTKEKITTKDWINAGISSFFNHTFLIFV